MSRASEYPRNASAAARRRAHRGRICRSEIERGQSLAELVIVLPFLLLLVFGILEVSRLLETQHTISALTREGANLVSRGTSLERTIETTRDNQVASGLGSGGGVVVSLLRVQNGVPRVENQEWSQGAPSSRIGAEGQVATPYQDIQPPLLNDHTYYVVEMSVPYTPFTPFPRLLENIVPEELYDRSLF